MNALLLVAVFALLSRVSALPGGAPLTACNRIYPEGHAGPSQDLTTNPYSLNTSSLDDGYTPGQTYALTLLGTQTYRGLLVQARTMADGSPVGSFQDISGDTRLSSCVRGNSAITHSNSNLKTSTALSWTAPDTGTGAIEFLFAVVEINRGGVSRFWATARSDVINEAVVPPEPLDVSFSGDTPVVTGNSVTAQISVSRPVPIRCQIVTRVAGEPTILVEKNCSNGSVTFDNVANGVHRLRVIAGMQEVIRNRVIVMSDNPEFCSLNAINEGITTVVQENGTAQATLEFRPIGKDAGFFCRIGTAPEYFSCASPLTLFDVSLGEERVKVIPNPEFCRSPNRRSLAFKF